MRKLTTRWYYTLMEIAQLYASNPDAELPLDVPPTDGLADFCGAIADAEGALSEDSPWASVDGELNEEMWAEYLWPEFRDATLLYVDKEVNPWEIGEDEEEPDRDEVWLKLKPILPRLVRWLKESTERYSVLIAAYQGIQSNLMGKVETVSSAQGQSEQVGSTTNTGMGQDSSSTSSSTEGNSSEVNSSSTASEGSKSHSGSDSKLDLHNDTPQSGGDFTTDPYVTDAHKITGSDSATDSESNNSLTNGSSSASNQSQTTSTTTGSNNSSTLGTSNISNNSSTSSTVGSDVTTPIERLNEVRQKLHNLFADWAAEFAQFIIYAD